MRFVKAPYPHRTTGADLFEAGWLSPHAAAAALGCTVGELYQRHRLGEIKRKSIAPGVYLFDVSKVRA